MDGGHFIDGSTSNRYQYLNDTEIIGEFKTNPIKDGYKFLYWVDSSGNEFDFNTKLSNDIILKAVYEKYEESKYYCENKNDVFDPSTALCYSVLKTYDDNEPFNNTTYRYKANEWMCYAYYGDVNNPGAISRIKGIPGTITGKNNKTDGVYEGYTSDSWRSKNTCLFGSPCTKDATRSGNVITWYKYDTECEVKWNTILYKVSDSVSNSDYNYYDDGSGGKQNKEADNSPKTGNAIVYLAWAAIIGACGYSIYYFKYRKEDESTTW